MPIWIETQETGIVNLESLTMIWISGTQAATPDKQWSLSAIADGKLIVFVRYGSSEQVNTLMHAIRKLLQPVSLP